MKNKFPISDFRFPISKQSANTAVTRHPSPVTRHPQKGVALVLTLILLAVVTIMAISFLAISRRERGAVTTVTDTAGARLAADAALAAAEAQIVANAFATTNTCSFGLLVSTNGWPLTFTNLPGDLTNLYASPRVPVYMNNLVFHTNENRFYLDLNRNGRFDTNGSLPVIGHNGGFLHPDGTEDNSPVNVVTNIQVGDPEWVGILQRPDAPYGPNNPFVARYAFIAVPIGNALDLNAIHNQVFDELNADTRVNPAGGDNGHDLYFRNQGVGSWEINLAAFLADLNTNVWLPTIPPDNSYYAYYEPGNFNQGRAFDDARALLAYRYANDYKTLNPVGFLFGVNGQIFQNDDIDGYSDGLLMTNLAGVTEGIVNYDRTNYPWAGADNTNHFFNHQELFDPLKTFSFSTNLLNAGTNNWGGSTISTYDRYTFYRLLAQLGTDSAPESGKLNINYINVDTNGNIVPGMETNFFAWTNAVQFFTNAADRLLRAYTTEWRNSNPTNFTTNFYAATNFNFGNADQWTNYPAFGVGNIPVLVSNRFVYSSAVNRLLQLAANIYDATTSRYYSGAALPTLFQPVFSKVIFNGVITNVYITNFVEFTGTGTSLTNRTPLDLGNPVDLGNLLPYDLVYGVPIIIGAKKGLPNFNQFAMQSAFAITRKLQITRTSTNAASSTYQVNQMFNCSVSNQFAVECWNSYFATNTRPTTIWMSHKIQMALTNDETLSPWYPLNTTNCAAIITNNWTGIGLNMNPGSFLMTNLDVVLLPTAVYQFGPRFFTTNLSQSFEKNIVINGSSCPQPHWWLTMTNNLQVVLIDTLSGRAIDYVQLNGPSGVRDLTAEILASPNFAIMWLANLEENSTPSGLPSGVYHQIAAAKVYYDAAFWGNTPEVTAKASIDGLNNFYHDPVLYNRRQVFGSTNLEIGVIGVSALTVQRLTWQANDPLVHYIISDLTDTANDTSPQHTIANPLIDKARNERYQPWGIMDQMTRPVGGVVDVNPYNLALKDPLVRKSDDWDFPTNKFPTVGWLGRVHRGTPWQTVYLKSRDVLTETNSAGSNLGTNTWVNWTGNLNLFDATNAAPVKDRLLFDIFTTAFNDNATRGTLSVNVGPTNANLAAWSALFSGIVVPPASSTNTYSVIGPAGAQGANSLLWKLVNGTNGINDIRARFTNADGLVGSFKHVGDILAVPALTERSPFLNLAYTNYNNDEMYEWLPQQVMSLLRCSSSPRYVIYCYGQALKPAPNSFVTTSGSLFGMVTNYQVVSEAATRAVVRFDSMVTNVITTNSIGNWYSMPVVTNNNAVIESFNLLPPD